jgi:hypothetical protein
VPQPPEYNRQYSFTSFQAINPSRPLPAAQHELEYNAIKQTLDAILANLALIQRDDGELANASVGIDQLAASIIAGLDPPELWATETNYSTVSTVYWEGVFYRSLETHTSGDDFDVDLAAGKWEEIADFTELSVELGGTTFLTGDITFSETEPVDPAIGDWWYDLTNGLLYYYLDDGNSVQWVVINRDATIVFNETARNARLGLFAAQTLSPDEMIFRFEFVDTVIFPVDLADSLASADVASVGSAVLSLQKNGVEFGTCTFNVSATGVFAAGSETTFTPGDVLTILAPNPADSALAYVAMTLAGIVQLT